MDNPAPLPFPINQRLQKITIAYSSTLLYSINACNTYGV
ncbi:hypothetical protein COO91_08211 [Nostoc flagelliforme CCNUN1]|uniref:Uncharacterized protein n=1 Tax=Nostoc flagelliforme CCNUN1 TaxID=2038116 RepID=A0A2K8T314_9NOSO|nr:hypothetical protein COO91_08211 [Nostoc flagelliforme CCNUN1]